MKIPPQTSLASALAFLTAAAPASNALAAVVAFEGGVAPVRALAVPAAPLQTATAPALAPVALQALASAPALAAGASAPLAAAATASAAPAVEVGAPAAATPAPTAAAAAPKAPAGTALGGLGRAAAPGAAPNGTFDGSRGPRAGSDDVFTPMTPSQKADFLKRYVEHLRRRDGEPDVKTRTFSVREKFFQEIAKNPVARPGAPAVDPKVYARNETADIPETSLSDRTLASERALWALMTGKANRGEAFAVKQLMKRPDYKNPKADDPMVWIAIEEFYHTRILKDTLKVLGLDMRELDPPAVVKALAYVMARLPKSVSNMFVMTSEVIGVAIFKLLLDKARQLFADDAKSLARIEELFQQIIVDEVGHVHYIRSQLGPVRLWIAKKLIPFVLNALVARGAESELLFGRKGMIDEAKKAAIDGAAASYPDRLKPFGV